MDAAEKIAVSRKGDYSESAEYIEALSLPIKIDSVRPLAECDSIAADHASSELRMEQRHQ